MIHRRHLLAAVSAAVFTKPAVAAEPVTVFAAASLQDVLQEIGKRYERKTGQAVRFSFAASSAIARQIEQGAPAHLFISADEAWMDYVAARRLILPASRLDIVGNRLALIAPRDSSTRLRIGRGMNLTTALGRDGRLAMAAAEVPAGRYGEAALRTLGVWDSVQARTVRGESVRTALAFVARGEAPLGIVYETDAKAEPRVRLIGLFPAGSHPKIVYPAAVVGGQNQKAGADFLAYLRSREAAAVFTRFGFSRP